eukprot:GHVS01051567.1.p1 GENE.GHVS01051567.1~~GHVS01051567.1.p1  ORF type:complete len:500 (+),score=114.20 GHVS01051567.1:93-1502(+)
MYQREVCHSVQWLLRDIAPTDSCVCYIHNVPSNLPRPIHFPPSIKQIFAQHFYKYKRERHSTDQPVMFPCVISPVESEAVAFGYPQDWPAGLAVDLLQYDWVKVLLEFDYTMPSTNAQQQFPTVHINRSPEHTEPSSPLLFPSRPPFPSFCVSTLSPPPPLSELHLSPRLAASSLSRGQARDPDTMSVSHGTCTLSGTRTSNEDRVAFISGLADSQVSFFAVYDGHNGEAAAQFAVENLHRIVSATNEFIGGFHLQALQDAFTTFDQLVKHNVVEGSVSRAAEAHHLTPYVFDMEHDDDLSAYSSGTTACVCLLSGNSYTIANVGDSRCVLSRSGHAVVLTRDHRLNYNKDEQQRILKCGASFDDDGYLEGCLSVSRAFGDFDKLSGRKLAGLSADAEMVQDVIGGEDEFMLLACDGVFDVMTNQEAVTVVQSQLRTSDDLYEAAAAVCALACKRKSLDNLSVIIVLFK